MSVKKEKIKVFGMTFTSCESRVERAVIKLDDVKTALASFNGQYLTIEYNPELCDYEKIKIAIKTAGYSTESSINYKIVGIFIVVAAIILIATIATSLIGNKTLPSAQPAAKPHIENGVQIIRMTADCAGYTLNGLSI